VLTDSELVGVDEEGDVLSDDELLGEVED